MIPTGFVWDERYLQHDVGSMTYTFDNGEKMIIQDEMENKYRAILIKEMLEKTGILPKMKAFSPYYATTEDLLRVHSLEHIERVKKACAAGQRELGSYVYACSLSEEIARLSAGGAMKAVDICMTKDIFQAYALIRPPGHHATRDSAMGYCIYNNVAVAASYALKTYKLNRVLILDWDVHHGNGTEDIFYDRDDVLFISIHEDNNYPENSGQIDRIGILNGEGYNINVPLPSATGDEGYRMVFEEIVSPIVAQYQPDLIIVSAGQDCNVLDPMARMAVLRPGFRYMGRKIRELAQEHSGGKLAVIQEGGYSLPYLPIATLGVMEGLMDIEVSFEDPHGQAPKPLDDKVKDVIDKVTNTHRKYWKFNYQHN